MDDAASRLARLMDGYLVTQLLYVAARLGVADALASGSRTAAEVAHAVGAHPSAILRVLRGLAAEEVLTEDDAGRFALTDVGSLLRDRPGSQRGPAIVRGRLYFRAAGELLDAVVHGGTAFEAAYGQTFFAHLDEHTDDAVVFQDSMTGRAAREADHVVAAYDFGVARRLVDIGGGRGVLLSAVLRAATHVSAVLFDRPGVVEQARQALSEAGLADRCEFVTGDFFTSVPHGADTYLLSRVIHDWDDEHAVRVLTACRGAVAEGGRLLLVETVLPRRARDQPAAVRMDLHMLMLLGARERSAAEFETLLARAGWHLKRIAPTGTPDGLCVIEAV